MSEVRLAVLGDSIAWGMGAARPEDRLAPRLARGLAAHGYEALVHVVAVPGARTAALPSQVDEALMWGPDVAVVVIGANDLTHLQPAEAVAEVYREALSELRLGCVEVVVAPAPDLSSVPYVPAQLRDVVRAASEHLRQKQIAVAQAEGARVADAEGASSRAFATDRSLFSADLFHPSSAGYALIAATLLPEVLAALSR